MNTLILLFLVIGAVVSQTFKLTTTAAASGTDPLWSLTTLPTTDFSFLRFTLSYDAGAAPTDAILAIDNSNFGVACMIVDSAFDLTAADDDSARRKGFSLSVRGQGAMIGASNTGSDTNWLTLMLHQHNGMKYKTTGTIEAGLAVAPCSIVLDPVATIPERINNVLFWTFDVTDSCGNIPTLGSTWYAKCFAIPSTAVGIPDVGPLADIPITNARDVTFTVPAAVTICATETGASTFATGATILAGIAYLQF
jgi:hypothetical protein